MKNLTFFIILLSCAISLNAQRINIPGDHSTIQAGIDAASDGDTILLLDSKYLENIRFNGKAITLASKFILDKDTSHIGKTIIDGSSPSNPDTASTIYLADGAAPAVIMGITITGGKGTLRPGKAGRVGGGLYIDNSACILDHCNIRDNDINYNYSVVSGGGIYNNQGQGNDLTIRHCTISNNKLASADKASGAGLAVWAYNEERSTIIIENNVISGNTANSILGKESIGGGISYSSVLPTNNECRINNNIIQNNELHSTSYYTYGGAIRIHYTEPGGFYDDDDPSPEIYNNIITDNKIDSASGGAIGIWTNWSSQTAAGGFVKPQPVIVNNTVVDNVTAGTPGIFNRHSSPMVLNNIFWNTSIKLDAPELNNRSNHGIIYAYNNDIKGGVEGHNGIIADLNNISEDPTFIDGSYALSEHSLCVGRGASSVITDGYLYECPALDFNNNARPDPIDDHVDIGAIESPYYKPSSSIFKTESINNDILIHPNPVTDQIRVSSTSGKEITRIEIMDVLGKPVRILNNVNSDEVTIQRGKMEQGVYIIRVHAGEVYALRIIVK